MSPYLFLKPYGPECHIGSGFGSFINASPERDDANDKRPW